MESREVTWLRGELPKLVAEGVLTPETAAALARRYASPDAGPKRTAWGQVVLAGFGALLVGGGICLILAHNWDELSRSMRAGLVIGGLLLAQALAAFALFRRERSAAWIEPTSALLVSAVGTAIALVSQTYHIPGSLESFYRAWLWLVVLIPYLTGSSFASILFWGLVIVRALTWEGWRPPGSTEVEPWIVAAAGVPFVVRQLRSAGAAWSTAFLAWTCASAVFVLGITTTLNSRWNGLWAVFAVSYFAAIYAAAAWPPESERLEPWRRRLNRPAAFGLLVTGILLSFEAPWRYISAQSDTSSKYGSLVVAAVSLACVAVAAIVGIRLFRAGVRHVAIWAAGAPLVVVAHAIALSGQTDVPWLLFNLWLAVAGVASVLAGIRENRFAAANQGLAALAMVVGARFFDVEVSFLVRGLGFVFLGLACLALNVFLIRRSRRSAA